MDMTNVEQVIMDRFFEKCRMAGGPRPGYVLRRQAVTRLQDDQPDLDFEAGLTALTEKGLLLSNEAGNLLYLSEAGSEALAARGA